ncbi:MULTISPECIES: pyruvate kinase [unclassified Cyanobium]|uniref:pyruvate kinase n=1 Tax=unclassified Cyanobium TaxID=2627006 RepID=UPI0020CD827A|nr:MULTISPECIES: pyruvate kinase [unclassified Cyanobium]MCP9835178.1 pyruvate kinase [Cyanobium sp. La Preciosa 7G6]MCP9937942.1 pyruvate kinase [Cyanobium sp. Aljojuca 7A6]
MKDPTPATARWLLDTLRTLRTNLERIELEEADCLEAIHPDYRASARNLLHFIAFHRHAHPGLPKALRQRGLCPLTDCDAHLLSSLEAVITALEALEGLGSELGASPGLVGPDVLERHCDRLFGALAAAGVTGIMVTLPAEAAEQPALIADLLQAGMTIARINCAHDDPVVWGRMVDVLTQARVATGRPCAIAMDLAGPKLRTGQLAPQPAVIRARPPRDRLGRPTQPVRILAVPSGARPMLQDAEVVLLPARLSRAKRLKAGHRLRGQDASGRRRTLTVVRRVPDGVVLQAEKSCHFVTGLMFRQRHGKARLVVGPLAPVSGERLLRPGEAIRLTPEPDRGPGTLPCTLPEVFGDLRLGERVLFDDGRIAAVIRGVSAQEVRLVITAAQARGSRLRSDKGINFPDSDLRTPALTAKDIEDLAFVTRHADMISYSFVHRDSDIQTLRQCLEDRGRGDLAVVLKIETRQAFLNLPRLLLAAMGHGAPVGVMIARGDLAIECGWEALAPIQEEILRICAAAHVPCIWATEVLDTLAQHGHPTRAEITDASMGARADAVMLNKGPNITATVKVLEAIVASSASSEPMLTCLAFQSNCEPEDQLP